MTDSNLVASMLAPGFYPHPVEAVDLIETHISYVFLAGGYVYKLKKGVNLGFLDFSGLAERQHFCHEELRLNKRLAPSVYLEVIPVCVNAWGRFTLGHEPQSQPIDYVLKMIRLPEEGMFPRLLEKGQAVDFLLELLAARLASFHQTTPAVPLEQARGFITNLQRNMSENFSQTRHLIKRAISKQRHRMISEYSDWFFQTHQEILLTRAASGRVRECHGDLRLEHICLYNQELVIFDCIEFNARFRQIDVAADLAFLLMDLEHSGHQPLARDLVHGYLEKSHDQEIRILLNFYKCYYACTRAKVAGIKSAEQTTGIKQKASLQEASDFFDLAFSYALHLVRPTLILVCGLMGTGKSTLARNIGPYLGATVIRSDVVRKELVHIETTQRQRSGFGEGIYSPEISKLTYARLFSQAAKHLRAGRSVILDASFKRQRDRDQARMTATDFAARFLILECSCQEQTIKNRLQKRMVNPNEPSDGRWELFQAQRDDFEQIREVPSEMHVQIETDRFESECRDQTLEAIIRRLRPASATGKDQSRS